MHATINTDRAAARRTFYQDVRYDNARLFVYGTLRRGQPLAPLLDRSVVAREEVTVPGFTLVVSPGAHFPWMIPAPNKTVAGEALEVILTDQLVETIVMEQRTGYTFRPIAENLWGFVADITIPHQVPIGSDWIKFVSGQGEK